ncbi:MAG: BLUF domain-containing protein [Rhodoferax sp.]|uniref:BLUF domain-containing protein n=1 Tax=Rhodoferax sp. TaxID=50421 RepID=UPI00301631FD
MALIQLIFESSLIKNNEQSLASIFNTSRRRNRENQISGAVILSGTDFIEVLEGESDVVQDTLQRIKDDRRHTLKRVWDEQAIPERNFSRWNSGYRRSNAINDEKLSLSEYYFFDGVDMTFIWEKPSRALEALLNFRACH